VGPVGEEFLGEGGNAKGNRQDDYDRTDRDGGGDTKDKTVFKSTHGAASFLPRFDYSLLMFLLTRCGK
jgi:hypothetical protein